MGTWGAGCFSNDAALDFVQTLENADVVVTTIQSVRPAPLGVDDASEILAAADLIAAMAGRPALDMPENALKMLGEYRCPERKLLETARYVVEQVRDGSGLAELWAENDDQEWTEAIADLLQRLDPDVEYEPRRTEDGPTGAVFGLCFICEEDIAEIDIVDLVHEYDDGIVQSTMTLYAHRACIEHTFEPPHWNRDGSPSDPVMKQLILALGLDGDG